MSDLETQSRLLAKLTRSVLATERFESLADLADAVKFRCAKLRLPCDPEAVSAAFAMIASNHPIVGDATATGPRCDHKFVDSTHCLKCGWMPPDATAMTRAEAAAVLARLGVRV